jgi:hypothetical protein
VAKERLRVMLRHSYGPQMAMDDGGAERGFVAATD